MHADNDCVDCHQGERTFANSPHNRGQPLKLNCAGGECHTDVVREYQASIHGKGARDGVEKAAQCPDCHGRHDILSADDETSPTNKFNLPKTCGRCHEDLNVVRRQPHHYETAVSDFVDSIHGRALLVSGLAVAPTCTDCHGVHDIAPGDSPESSVSPARIPETCGKCHVKIAPVYAASIHGQLPDDPKKRHPVCNTCHTSHTIHQPDRPVFRLAADKMCGGECHVKELKSYDETFHGKAIALGRPDVATCFDCHGHHDITKIDDPASPVGERRRIETCRKCHPGARERFAGYLVHADHRNRKDYPALYYTYVAMTALLLGVFGFFAIHTALWLYRTAAVRRADPEGFRARKRAEQTDGEYFSRFLPFDRFLHGLVIVSFLLLVATGMPLKYHDAAWAHALLRLFGGQAYAAVLHRIGAIITGGYFAMHLGSVAARLYRGRAEFRRPETGRYSLVLLLKFMVGPDSLVPNGQDFRDLFAHVKWFIGKGERPQFDRWTYWEKFDYMAVFWGVAMIGLSGLIMWFPVFFTRWLPGSAINVAQIIHSDEALLAAGFIFLFHFFNVHLRPEKFPIDPVIFSGRISKTEILHERRKLFERWAQRGELEQHRWRDEWPSWRRIVLPVGYAAWMVGVALIALIIYAIVSH